MKKKPLTLEQRINKKGVVLVEFNAPWCVRCKLMDPTIKELAEKNKGLQVITIDISVEKSMQKKYNIMSLPTIIFFKDGIKSKRFNDLCYEGDLQDTINKLK